MKKPQQKSQPVEELYYDYAKKRGLPHDPTLHPPSWRTEDQLSVDKEYEGKTLGDVVQELEEYPDQTPPSWVDPRILKRLGAGGNWNFDGTDDDLFQKRPDIRQYYNQNIQNDLPREEFKGQIGPSSSLSPEDLMASKISGEELTPEQLQQFHQLINQNKRMG